ncbi:PREDICTED: kinesin-like protein KIN-7E, chloroplastic isoform X2 [Hipposideros armiger]|uniref:Kinesin-like protein KIN-7E, chloroplastic isoform X2 n=1 Tax=Hipposideros armiger TaxID=186990 RepID=A0A8B7QXH1_HIPAR|nr:PREDICTED: kinesin-like protein KIN-7E, chloroplastic isoform X2 [Hipposideros armiger]
MVSRDLRPSRGQPREARVSTGRGTTGRGAATAPLPRRPQPEAQPTRASAPGVKSAQDQPTLQTRKGEGSEPAAGPAPYSGAPQSGRDFRFSSATSRLSGDHGGSQVQRQWAGRHEIPIPAAPESWREM